VLIEGIGRVEKVADGSIRFLPGTSPEPDEAAFVLDESGNIDHTGTEVSADMPEITTSASEILDESFVIDQTQDNGSGHKEIPAGTGTHQSDSPEESRVIPAISHAQPVQRKKIPLPVKITALSAGAILIILLSIRILSTGPFSDLLHRQDSTCIQAGNEGPLGVLAGELTTGNVKVEDEPLPGIDKQPVDSHPLQTAGSVKNNYHVVAGCFADLQNAEKYVILLKQHGYNPRIIGVRKNLHVVSFDSFGKKQEALLFMEKTRKEFEPEAWVLYYRNP
jgi:hypothetical protein